MSEEDDYIKKLAEARKKAKLAADAKTSADLDVINAQADTLQGIFDSLKLDDQTSYNQLVQVVNEASAANESVSGVVARLNALGDTGKGLASSIATVASTGPIGILTRALGMA